ncbi:gastric triacylglycerol lipase isoform X2 [Dermacentor silvarum]|uniref:gastric triacylglycerol lipase isoform X2 n=1 Tax=Dermacentor silvarum TaxID=543639 RepID=UPI002101B209|nr:gastric triacylglycerol lipase isoform X2 [Dermacentor silvarum]
MGTFSTVTGRLLILFIVTASTLGKAADERTLQARLTPCELIKYHGYPCELSYATTDDGYLLEVDHVPYGREGSPSGVGDKRTPRYPVLLVPAFTSASDMWFLNYPSQSPGFLLADRGFDVWSMNSREAKPYSNHTTLSQRDSKYWRWSFDEIGRYDVAAGVDHVLKATGAPKLTIMALSQGVTITLVFLSTRPEYNEKVDLVIAYGPVANITHAGPPLSVAMPLLPPVLTRIPVYVGHFPMGTTVQNMRHYHQMYKAKNFVMYDHGATENRQRYGQVAPPAYPLERITTSIALFTSEGDFVADTRDVEDLVTRLGSSVILHRVVPEKTFAHVDFALGYRANKLVHNMAIDIIRQHATRRS